MTRTSGGRLAAAIIVGLAVLPLSGCLYAQIPEHPTVVDDDPVPTDEPTDETTGDLPTTMSFADGAELPPAAYIQWGDGLIADSAWQLSSPDDGNGNWSYSTVDGTCTAAFWQGTLDGLDTVPGDDAATTDDVLEFFLGSDLDGYTQPASLSYQSHGNRDVDAHIVSWSDEGHDRAVISRAFGVPGVGLYISLDCTGGDITSVMDELVDKNAVIIMP